MQRHRPVSRPFQQTADAAGTSPYSPQRRFLLAAGLMALALALRWVRIDAIPLWHDEAYTYLAAREPLGQMVEMLKLDSAPPLYFALLHYWMPLAGDSETGMRAMSALLAVAMVGLVFATGTRLISPAAGLWAGLFMAVSPVQVYYSQHVRMYTLMPLGGLIAMYALARLLEENRWRFVVLAWFGTSVCLYAHTFGLFLLPAAGLLVAVARPVKDQWPKLAALAAAVALTWLPWLGMFLVQLGNKGPTQWFYNYYAAIGSAGSLAWTVSSFSPGGAQTPIVVGLGSTAFGGMLPTLLCGGLALYGAVQLVRGTLTAESATPNAAVRRWFPLIYLLAPALSAIAVSVILQPVYAAGRTDQLFFPAFCLLVGAGVAAPPLRMLRLSAGAAILLCAAITLEDYYSQEYKQTEREWSAVLAEKLQPGEPVVCTSLTRTTTSYYLHRHGIQPRLISYPREAAEHLGYFSEPSLRARPDYLREEAQAIEQQLRQWCGPGGRFFVLVSVDVPEGTPIDVNQPLIDRLMDSPDLKMEGEPLPFQQVGLNYGVFLLTFRFHDATTDPTRPPAQPSPPD